MYILYSIINECAGYLIIIVLKIEAPYLYYLFTLFEFCLFTWYFYLIIHDSIVKKLLPVITIAFAIFTILDYFFLQDQGSFNSISSGIETVLIIAMCIYYFFDQLKQTNTFLIYSSSNFWIIIAFLVYLSGTFFLYIYAESMLADPAFRRQYIIINSFFTILKNVLLSVAMLMSHEKDNSKPEIPEDRLNADWNADRSIHNLN